MNQIKKHEQDTGSIEMQVARLTDAIDQLTKHIENNPKDFSSKHGLIKMVNRRRKFLKYLERTNHAVYATLLKQIKEV
jgi:small subunit ribosomal protein S15